MKSRFEKLNKRILEASEGQRAELEKIRQSIAKEEGAKKAAEEKRAEALRTENHAEFVEAEKAISEAASNISFYRQVMERKQGASVIDVVGIRSEVAAAYKNMTNEAEQEIAEHINAIFDTIARLRSEYITEQATLTEFATAAGLAGNALHISADRREIKRIMDISQIMQRFGQNELGPLRDFPTKYKTLNNFDKVNYWNF